MSQIQPHTHTPWLDRFNTPTIQALLEQYEGSASSLAENALAGLTEIMESPPSVEWKGLPWRWTCVYRAAGEVVEPSVYLVATPDWPSIALPVPQELASEMLSKRGSKYLKETLLHSCQVGQIRWAEWSIQGRAQLSDVLGLAAAIINGQPA